MKEVQPGLFVEQVGDLIGGVTDEPAEPLPPSITLPPRLDGQPEYPAPGIYFGMPEEVYHSIYACSASGLKDMMMSSMDHWAKSNLNPEKEEGDNDTIFKTLGTAYHKRILEGDEAFKAAYCPMLEKEDLGERLVVTVDDIRKALEALEIKPKGTAKGPLIEQLLDADPDAVIWDRECQIYAEMNDGKIQLPLKSWQRIQRAARMIESDPQLKDAIRDGHPEVALFWIDPKTGAAMKAKLDYLKLLTIVDLKSFSNSAGRPVSRAIDFAIANQRHYLAIAVYLEGVAAVKELVKQTKGAAVFQWYEADDQNDAGPGPAPAELKQWAWKWAHQPEPTCLWIYQQTGHAPVTRGREMVKGNVYLHNKHAVQQLKQKWVECVQTYGSLPWVDAAPIERTTDEAIPLSGIDFGEPK